MSTEQAKQRVDKWLWFARFFKTRSLSAKTVSGGHVRVNGQKISKPSHTIAVGDVLTFPQARIIRVVQIEGLAERRGPAAEAQLLYLDMTEPRKSTATFVEPTGSGRPTKRDRRKLDNMKSRRLED